MRGFAHVQFEDNDAAVKALAKAGESFNGRDIRVDLSQGNRRQRKNYQDQGFTVGAGGGLYDMGVGGTNISRDL